jgi:hypothetical protein
VSSAKDMVNAVMRALQLVTEAMDLLDAHGGPADVASHLSLAQEGLRREVRVGSSGSKD